jgi:hypothetical protein
MAIIRQQVSSVQHQLLIAKHYLTVVCIEVFAIVLAAIHHQFGFLV